LIRTAVTASSIILFSSLRLLQFLQIFLIVIFRLIIPFSWQWSLWSISINTCNLRVDFPPVSILFHHLSLKVLLVNFLPFNLSLLLLILINFRSISRFMSLLILIFLLRSFSLTLNLFIFCFLTLLLLPLPLFLFLS